MASPEAIATALAPLVKELSSLKDDYHNLKQSINPTLERLEATEQQLRDTLADKAELEQKMLLGNAQKLARKRAWRVSGVPKLIGLGLMLPSMPFFFISMFHPPFQSYFIVPYMIAGCGLSMGFISIRPNDIMGIRCIAALGPPMFLQNLPMLGVPLYFLISSRTPFPDGEHLRLEVILLVGSNVWAMFFFLYFAFKTLKHKHGKRMPFVADKALKTWATTRYGSIKGTLLAQSNAPVAWAIREQLEGNFLVPPRKAHQLFNKLMPWCCVVCYLPVLILSSYYWATEDSATVSPNCARHTRMVVIGGGTQFFLWLLIFTPWFRAWYYTVLNRMSNKGDAGRAAGVAALIGKKDVSQVLTQARRSFQGVPFHKFKLEHFLTNEADADLMHGLAQRCQLGEVDAFLSHSWHDDPHEKWEALTRWAAHFEAKHGRAPMLWFDKACLKQDDIEDQLAQLPVFLAGSRTLLCIIGPTYSQRIWCLIEIFTFLRMGGTADRLTVVPIGDGSEDVSSLSPRDQELREDELLNVSLERFRLFDVSAAQCFSEEQLLHLLSVIESGFGSFDTFNSIVRTTFANKLEELLADNSRGSAGGTTSTKPLLAKSASSHAVRGAGGLLHRVTPSAALVAPHPGGTPSKPNHDSSSQVNGNANGTSTRSAAALEVEEFEAVAP